MPRDIIFVATTADTSNKKLPFHIELAQEPDFQELGRGAVTEGTSLCLFSLCGAQSLRVVKFIYLEAH